MLPGLWYTTPTGTTTLRWFVGTVPAASGQVVIVYTARPGLLFLGGLSLGNHAALDFSDRNGNDYPDLGASAITMITDGKPTRDPLSLGYWRNHPIEWADEILARIQATDSRYDGADGTPADGVLTGPEVAAALAPAGNMPNVLKEQVLAVYFNLAARRIEAATTIMSETAGRLGLATVRARA